MRRRAALILGTAVGLVVGAMLLASVGANSQAAKAAGPGSVAPAYICCPGGGGGGGGYLVTFNETGLPANTFWSNSIYTGSSWFKTTGDTASVTSNSSWTNGTWQYKIGKVDGYASTPSSGTVTVNGENAYVQVQFARASYDVYFNETGLPSGSDWWCTLSYASNGTVYMHTESDATSCVISAYNGAYTWTVTPPQYYYAGPHAGSVTVNGNPVTGAKITFGTRLGIMKFTQTGLTTGTTWWVTLSNATWSLNLSAVAGTPLEFDSSDGALLHNGTYHYVVAAPAGYTASPESSNPTITAEKTTSAEITFKK
jgi:hypothetical protein